MEQNIIKADVEIKLNGEEDLDVWHCITQARDVSSLEVAGTLNDRELEKLNNFPHLCSLTMVDMPVTGKAFRNITNLKHLPRIEFRHCGCTDAFFDYVQNVCSLETLVIANSKLRKPHFENLIHLKKLYLLDLHDCSLNDEAMMSFPNVSPLSWPVR